jgi:hypothetical protein
MAKQTFNKDHLRLLLTACEHSGLLREEFDVSAHTALYHDHYGPPGDQRRLDASKRWNRIKNLPIEKYLAYLKKKEVPPGINTKILHQTIIDKKMGTTSEASTHSSTRSRSNSVSSGSSRTSSLSSLRSKKSSATRHSHRSLRSQKKKASGKKPKNNKLKATPSKHNDYCAPTVDFAAMTIDDGSPYTPRVIYGGYVGGTPSTDQTAMEIQHVPTDDFLIPCQDNCWGLVFIRPSRGTKRAPILQQVDLKMPEKNGIFDITLVENMERDEFERTGVHIRMSIDDNDQGKWGARIPRSSEYPPEFKGRVVIVQGPAVSFWLSMTGIYHEILTCPATKKAHENADKLRDEDKTRKDVYYALIFPPGIYLDNQILSSHENQVPQKNNLLDLAKNHHNNDAGQDIEGMTIYWEIAFAGGREIGEQKKEQSQSDIRSYKKAARLAIKKKG